MTPAEVREHVETGLGDGALTRLLADAEADVARVAGPVGPHAVRRRGGARRIYLPYPATVTTVTEDGALADEDAFRVWHDLVVEHVDRAWQDPVDIELEALIALETRERVTVDLVRLAIEYRALTSERVGDYSSTAAPYQQERTSLLNGVARGRVVA